MSLVCFLHSPPQGGSSAPAEDNHGPRSEPPDLMPRAVLLNLMAWGGGRWNGFPEAEGVGLVLPLTPAQRSGYRSAALPLLPSPAGGGDPPITGSAVCTVHLQLVRRHAFPALTMFLPGFISFFDLMHSFLERRLHMGEIISILGDPRGRPPPPSPRLGPSGYPPEGCPLFFGTPKFLDHKIVGG